MLRTHQKSSVYSTVIKCVFGKELHEPRERTGHKSDAIDPVFTNRLFNICHQSRKLYNDLIR